jgi:hypothetical protein
MKNKIIFTTADSKAWMFAGLAQCVVLLLLKNILSLGVTWNLLISVLILISGILFIINLIIYRREVKKWSSCNTVFNSIEQCGDLINRDCEIVLIEDEQNSYVVYFDFNKKRYVISLHLGLNGLNQNQRALLVSDNFQFSTDDKFKNIFVESKNPDWKDQPEKVLTKMAVLIWNPVLQEMISFEQKFV